jgi:hypothetical protein
MDVSGQHHDPVALPPGRKPVRMQKEAELVPNPVWTLRQIEKSLGTVANRIPYRPDHSLITIPYYSIVYYPTSLQDLNVRDAYAASSSQIRMPDMLILLIKRRCWDVLP